MSDRCLIWGAGAIGGTIGAFLARAGQQVTLVDSVVEHVAAINHQGLRLSGPIAEFTAVVPALLPDDVEGTWDVVVLATKAHHTHAAIRALAPHVSAEGFVVSAQNGLNEIEIAEVVGNARTVGAIVNFGADYLEPGVIHYGGRGAVVLGETDGRATDRVTRLCESWREFDDRAMVTPNIWGFLWAKEAYGAMLFATALTNASIADALAMPDYRSVYTTLAREVLGVATARGVSPESFDGFEPTAFLPSSRRDHAERSLDALVAHNRKSAKTHSGIWRDLAVRKRPTEVEAQLGIVVRLAHAMDQSVPVLERLVELVHAVERGERPQSLDTLDELLPLLPHVS